jgi:GNAT superfamily N-acetyltransferase
MVEIRRLQELSHAEIESLVRESSGEGFRFIERLVAEWEAGRERFDRAGAVLLGAFDGPALLAIGGLTPDPYGGVPGVGRLRHIYVSASVRRRGVGRQLVAALESWATAYYRVLVLRTDTAAAASFYEGLGYRALPPGGTATHERRLSRWTAPSALSSREDG